MAFSLGSLFSGGASAVETITGSSAVKFHGDADTVFVDVRNPGELAASGTIKGAVRAPLPEFARYALPDGSGALPAASANPRIICVCASGARSAAAAQHLVQMGYTNVANLRGGFSAWSMAGGPTER